MKKTKSNPVKVAMFYNVYGWAWWHRIQNIKTFIDSSVEITAVKIGDQFSHEEFDLIVIFESRYISAAEGTPSNKLIVGCSCPALMMELKDCVRKVNPIGVVVNNLEMWEVSKQWSNSYYCPNGVNTEIFYPNKSLPKKELAIWVGDKNSLIDKGLDLIESACENLKYPYLIVEKEALSKEGGLLTHEDLRDRIYHNASVLICASEVEGTPNPALEAMACGVPVISTKVGNMVELIEDTKNGFLVDRTTDNIENALLKLRKSNYLFLRNEVIKSVNPQWSWEEKAKNYTYMFKDILERKSSKT